MKKALVILNGENIDSKEFYNNYLKEKYDIICADGGAEYAEKFGITPKMLFGDMDSISKEVLEKNIRNNVIIKKYPSEKDMTDTEIVLETLVQEGYEEIVLTGAVGGRTDHLLGNIYLLEKYSSKRSKLKIVHGFEEIEVLTDVKVLENEREKVFSIIPLTDNVSGLCISGAKYNVQEASIYRGDSRGISNETQGNMTEISLKNGKILLITNIK